MGGQDADGKALFLLVVATAIGSALEFYDFAVFSQLGKFITPLFWPVGNSELAQLSFWSTYAIAFIVRPLGALLFGHTGDRHSRKTSLVWSLFLMALPTVLMGCLPTYQHIGAAAPALLVIFRLVQGLAIGGENGVSIVLLFELLEGHRWRYLVVQAGYSGVGLGIALGTAVVLILQAALSQAQMELFGWRIALLLGACTGFVGLYLRRRMPDPALFIRRKQAILEAIAEEEELEAEQAEEKEQQQQHQPQHGGGGQLATTASLALSRLRTLSLSARPSTSSGGGGGGDDRPGRLSMALSSDYTTAAAAAAAVAAVDTSGNSSPPTINGGSATVSAPPPAAAPSASGRVPSRRDSRRLNHHHPHKPTYWPVLVMITHYWRPVLLQISWELWFASAFYIGTAWYPGAVSRELKASLTWTLLSTIVVLIAQMGIMWLLGWLCDGAGHPTWRLQRLPTAVGVLLLAAATAAPMGLTMRRGGLGACVAWQFWMVGLVSLQAGVLPGVVCHLYPPEARTTSVNFAHQVALGCLGGSVPLILTAINDGVGGDRFMAMVPVLAATAGVGVLASLAIWYLYPSANLDGRPYERRPRLQLGGAASANNNKGGGGGGVSTSSSSHKWLDEPYAGDGNNDAEAQRP